MDSSVGFLMMQYWAYFLLGSMFVFGFFTAWLAAIKGYNYGLWLFLGIFFGFIALISIGFAPIAPKIEESSEEKSEEPKKKIRFGGLNDE
jgi:hypothetical protein